MSSQTIKKHSAGFSLIELMIAMLIGLIILSGVIQIVISSKRSYLDNQAVSQIQENARFALDTLGREVKVAGYFGCMPLDDGEVESVVTGYAGYLTRGNELPSVEVIRDGALPTGIDAADVLSGDVLIVRHTDPNREIMLIDSLTNTDLDAAAGGAIKDGEPVALVSPGCELANVFTWDSADKPEGNFAPQNFAAGSRLSPVQVNAYYIGQSSVIDDMPALKREIILPGGQTRSEELAVGVSDMVLSIVEVTDGVVSTVDPNTNLANAKAIQITLTLRSHSKVNPEQTDDQGVVTDDGYISQTALATVRFRNKG